ncbi:NAD(P)-dependent oxidoreductase [Paraburkholderia caribensis]|jgi:3-hydroxyisobutyrate dehydrogenase|uniref:NAD(P)-dependent oxidoreductase n=1 Tax=Paraburkholderia caribensis TaxID=75105 RepID=UPI0006D420DE|nr:NAD(P)-dependent oxidoreductase [Paraburkholderia caribensis]ALP65671.1 3-hydroxyisobutyrate dehydrogenase [Paraburkholderia caribensis]AUT55405.1 NAD(P)-dependent oxidoreductase [Paraburkholderia caribensis]MDR6381738.1 3-hydroxyisobutyrate dehydrogenase [Paraburkholderia caribensis]
MPQTQEKHNAQQIGWIGLGKMGTPIVRNLLAAGFHVTVYDVDAARIDEAVRLGARRAEDLASVARSAPLVFSIIPDDAVLRKVALGAHGVIENANDGAVYIDMSTVSPTASGEVRDAAHKRGIGYICAPVSGSTVLADKAQLTVFASGPQDAYDRTLPVFEVMSARQYYVGEDQQARYLKLAINHLVGSTAVLLAEALTLGTKGGLDWARMLEVIGDSVAASPLVKYKLDPLKNRDFSPAFSSRQMLKDMSLVVDAGADAGVPMIAAALVREQFARYAEGDGADLDFFSIVRAVEAQAGISR